MCIDLQMHVLFSMCVFAVLTGDFAVPVVMENMREVARKRGGEGSTIMEEQCLCS